ncbi:DUF2691 family protein [Paenibacillus ihumii]|uniref:DUF2691 family protein n=1 Tax=Paenibacillus ihumii TaxID=687436 RepID=UPI0006D7C0C5|nr:DUF2691 family protein [Paenibacillus ihumii]
MTRGVSFAVPNHFGRLLGEMLEALDVSVYDWRIGSGESYLVEAGELGLPLFAEQPDSADGELFKSIIENNEYYLIFADLKAFSKGQNITDIGTYEEFLQSDCQLVLLVVDSVYVTIYCKNKEQLDKLYDHAMEKEFHPVQYITDGNDHRTKLGVW